MAADLTTPHTVSCPRCFDGEITLGPFDDRVRCPMCLGTRTITLGRCANCNEEIFQRVNVDGKEDFRVFHLSGYRLRNSHPPSAAMFCTSAMARFRVGDSDGH